MVRTEVVFIAFRCNGECKNYVDLHLPILIDIYSDTDVCTPK